jgi:SulP family sulfate permease
MNNMMKKIRHSVLGGILPFDRSKIPMEVLAGVVLATIAIPEVMGYAKIAGMPVITGIYTLLFPLVIFAIFCSSRHLIVGADSATAAILFSIMVPLATPGSAKYIALVSSTALLCAVLLIAARLFKLGFVADFLSRTVLVGFLSGVGIQVAISQLSGMFGISTSGIDAIPQLISFLMHLPVTSIPTLIVSVIVVVFIVGTRLYSKRFPGALIAVIGTIIASMMFNFSKIGVSSVGFVPSGLPVFSVPTFYVSDYYTLFVAAGACFIVIIAQSAATSRAYAIKNFESIDEDRDILGLALANGVAGLSGTFVINGSPTKTEVAVESGANSQLASLVTAAVVLVVLVFLTKPISFLPIATLSSIVFLIGINLVDLSSLKDIRSKMPSEFILALMTMATVILFGVLAGIIVAVIISMLWHLNNSYSPSNSYLTRNEKGLWVFAPISPGDDTLEGLIVYRFNRDLFYANSDKLMREALLLESRRPVKWFVLDTAGFSDIDYSSSEMLKNLCSILSRSKITFVITIPITRLKDQLDRSGVIDIIGEDKVFVNFRDAVEAYEKYCRECDDIVKW